MRKPFVNISIKAPMGSAVIEMVVLLFLGIFLLNATEAAAQAPSTISYQGRLTDVAGSPITEPTSVRFAVYSAPTDGTELDSLTLNVTPDANGVFTVELDFAPAVFDGSKRYLGIRVAGDLEMTPRQLLTSAPYSLNTNSIPDNAVTTGKIADIAVTTDKIADTAVTTAKIAKGAVLGSQLGNNAVTTTHIVDRTVGNDDLASDAVTSDKIADGAVTNADLDSNAVTSAKIALGAVGNSDLGISVVTSDKIADGTVTSDDIADGTITNSDISNAAGIAIGKIVGSAGVVSQAIGSHAGLTTTLTTLGSVTVCAPAEGYVLVMLTGSALIYGDHTCASVGVGIQTSGMSRHIDIGRQWGTATNSFYQPYTVTWVTHVVVGDTANIYALGQKSSIYSTNAVDLTNNYLTAIFFPTWVGQQY